MNATKPRLLACAVAMALSAFIAGCSTDNGGDSAISLTGTRWDGPDDIDDMYQVYFDQGGEIRLYAVDYNEWLNDDPNFELSWSQKGDDVTVIFLSLLDGSELVLTGTLNGDDLYIEGEDAGVWYSLDLTKVE